MARAVAAEISQVSGSCADMSAHFEAMWTFVKTPGVEPTNNHAERELRPLVMWRKRCFGSQSDRGERFVERALTVTHTLRKAGRSRARLSPGELRGVAERYAGAETPSRRLT